MNTKKTGWLVLSLAVSGFAVESQTASDLQSEIIFESQTAHVPQSEIIFERLQGILLLSSWEDLGSEPVGEVQGVESKEIALLDENSYFLEKIKAGYLDKPLTQGTLWDLKDEIVAFYQEKNQPFALVSIPKQNLSKGVLQIVVEEAKLGAVRSKGNRYFTGTELMQYIRTKPGEPIVMRRVVEDLAWMNQNQFRRTDAIFVPGAKPGTADIELATIDRWPYRIYAGADNTGTIATERERLFFGFNFGKTILRDSQVSYQFTFSPNWNRFYAHTASIRIPCPWRHVFVFWGGYSQVKPSLEEGNQGERGVSWQVDGRYRIPLMDTPNLMQELVVGYDFKEASNRIKAGRSTIFKATADINQFMLGYELGSRNEVQRVTLTAEAYANPSGMTEKNEKRDYERFRFEAGPLYAYLKIAHSFARKTARGLWFSYDLSGQIASKNLLPSEQFTLTGYHAVRGFEERILIVDNAALLNVALELPHWSPAKMCGAAKSLDELYFLAFFDGGIGCNHQRAPGERKIKTLGSLGPGVRYQFGRYATARLDYGFQLWHRGFHNPSHSRVNLGLIVSY